MYSRHLSCSLSCIRLVLIRNASGCDDNISCRLVQKKTRRNGRGSSGVSRRKREEGTWQWFWTDKVEEAEGCTQHFLELRINQDHLPLHFFCKSHGRILRESHCNIDGLLSKRGINTQVSMRADLTQGGLPPRAMLEGKVRWLKRMRDQRDEGTAANIR